MKKIFTWLRKCECLFKIPLSEPSYKLIGLKHSREKGYEICLVQFTRQNIFIEMDSLFLIENTEFLKAFSPEDIIKIIRLADNIHHKLHNKMLKITEVFVNANKIYAQTVGEDFYQTIFLNQLPSNSTLLNRFNAEDAFYLGRLAEAYAQKQEKEHLSKIKNTSNQPQFIIVDKK